MRTLWFALSGLFALLALISYRPPSPAPVGDSAIAVKTLPAEAPTALDFSCTFRPWPFPYDANKCAGGHLGDESTTSYAAMNGGCPVPEMQIIVRPPAVYRIELLDGNCKPLPVRPVLKTGQQLEAEGMKFAVSPQPAELVCENDTCRISGQVYWVTTIPGSQSLKLVKVQGPLSQPPPQPQPALQPAEPVIPSSVKLIGTGAAAAPQGEFKYSVRVSKQGDWFDTKIPLIATSMVNVTCVSDKCDFLLQAVSNQIKPYVDSKRCDLLYGEPGDETRYAGRNGNPVWAGYDVQVDYRYTLKLKVHGEMPYLDFIIYWRDDPCGFEENNPRHTALHAPHRQWARTMVNRFF
jgi:hypothetical protein